ncbi:uncharacterized protein isoform X2 [Choristoneura fumiferana]|uniref:uncharacterized protein isoform X2 n=1 Tax=Choristoneura fumiferana TaxID=7141 RepID=UPI003D15B7D5
MIQTKTKTCEKKLKIAELKILKIVSKINSLKLNDSDICQLDVVQKKGANILAGVLKCRVVLPVAILILVSAVWWLYLDLSTKKCLLAIPSTSKTLFRPPEDCSMCAGVDSVTRVANISAREFEDLYAYNTIPVIVTDATQDWKAVKVRGLEHVLRGGDGGAARVLQPAVLPTAGRRERRRRLALHGRSGAGRPHACGLRAARVVAGAGARAQALAAGAAARVPLRVPADQLHRRTARDTGGGHKPLVPPHHRAARRHQHHHRRRI